MSTREEWLQVENDMLRSEITFLKRQLERSKYLDISEEEWLVMAKEDFPDE